jgi:hypothetical protein
MIKINISYWLGSSQFKNLKYKHDDEIKYTLDQQTEIINDLINKGLNVMIRPFPHHLMIYIDDKGFQKR